MPTGMAYVFLFPFEIHSAGSLRQPEGITVNGRRVTVYPPFRNGDGLNLRRALVTSSLPYQPGTAAPAPRLPILEAGGAPQWPVPFILADALRLDVQGLGEQDSGVADAVGEHLLRLIRLVTRQWWILRGASESLAPLQNAFPIDTWGQPRGGQLYHTVHIIPWLQSEILLDSSALAAACKYLAAGVDCPVSCSTLLDAAFAMAHGNKDQAILLAAIACEALLTEQAFAAMARGSTTRAIVRRIVKVGDLRQRVSSGAHELFGRSFADDSPSAAAALGRLWVARHALAHGSEAQHARNAVLHDQSAFADAMFGAFRFFEWMASVSVRDDLDPMALFLRPLTPVA